MEESSEKKIRLLYLYLLREEGNERFFSLSLSNFFNFFSFLLPKMRKKNAKCLWVFPSLHPPPPPPDKTRRSREKYFILVRDWRCALDRLQKGRNEQGQLKKTQERDFYICVALDLAILFVQSAFPIVILLVTKRNESVNTVNAFLGISKDLDGGNRRDRRRIVVADLTPGTSNWICLSSGSARRFVWPYPLPLIALLKKFCRNFARAIF